MKGELYHPRNKAISDGHATITECKTATKNHCNWCTYNHAQSQCVAKEKNTKGESHGKRQNPKGI